MMNSNNDNQDFGEEQDYEAADLSLKRMIEQARVRETNRSSSFNDIFQNTNLDINDPFYIPPQFVPEDTVYFWAREYSGEKRDVGRTNYLINLGYLPVTVSEVPFLADQLDMERSQGESYMRRNGLLLMKIDKKRHQEILSQNQKRTDDLEQGIAEMESEGWSPLNDRRQREINRRMGIYENV